MRTFTDSLPAILPPNATHLERDLLKVAPFDNILDPAIPLVIIQKGNTTGLAVSFNPTIWPWLDIEYGLRQFSEFLPDGPTRIQQGLKFLATIGTPAAMIQAMTWIGFNVQIIEEDEPTIHFAEYQLVLDRAPVNKGELCKLIRLARIAQPTRSRLRRIIYQWDLPRMELDDTALDESNVDNYSGLWLDDLYPCGDQVTEAWISTTPRKIFG